MLTPESGLGPVLLLTAGSIGVYALLALGLERRRIPVEIAPRRIAGLLWGALFGALSFGIVLALMLVTGAATLTFNGIAWASLGGALFSGIAVAVWEEVLFRFGVFRILEELTGTSIAAIGSGVIFGVAHAGTAEATVWGIIAIMLQAGLPLALLYALTRSLWVVIAFHWAWNATQGPIVGAAVSGNESSPGIWTLNPHGPEILSGDAFGPEGSIFPVIVLGIVAVVLAVLLVRHIAVVAPMWTRRARQRVTG